MSEKGFIVTVVSAVALVTFVFVMRFLPDFVAWNGWDLCGTDCNLRAWLDALSGWFGGIAAFATIGFVVLQLREQKLQTVFTVGDALPTMDAVEHLRDSTELVVRIVNWNRRGIVVRGFDAGISGAILFPLRLEVDTEEIPDFARKTHGIAPFTLKGWEDRSKGPHHCEIRFECFSSGVVLLTDGWSEIPSVQAHVQILGDRHKQLTLTADTGVLRRRPLMHR
ncbi:hypothetical protein [Rhizobium herbae]